MGCKCTEWAISTSLWADVASMGVITGTMVGVLRELGDAQAPCGASAWATQTLRQRIKMGN